MIADCPIESGHRQRMHVKDRKISEQEIRHAERIVRIANSLVF